MPCAALRVGSRGNFAGQVLLGDLHWQRRPTYIFGSSGEAGTVEFSDHPTGFPVSGRVPEVTFDGMDVIGAGTLFEPSFSNFNLNNRASC